LNPAHRLPVLLGALALSLALLAGASVTLVWATLDATERDAVAAVLASRAMLVVMLWLAVFALASWGLSRLFGHYVEAPARLQEQALVDYFSAHSGEVSARVGKKIDLASLKPYTGTHNSGYTECQEFFGAITLDSHEPLGRQIVTMLDVALRGIGNYWNDVVIPGFDFCVVENTLGKYGTRVERLTRLPIDVQDLVMR